LKLEEYSLYLSSRNEEESAIPILACVSPSHPLCLGVVSVLVKAIKPWEMLHLKGPECIPLYWSRRYNY